MLSYAIIKTMFIETFHKVVVTPRAFRRGVTIAAIGLAVVLAEAVIGLSIGLDLDIFPKQYPFWFMLFGYLPFYILAISEIFILCAIYQEKQAKLRILKIISMVIVGVVIYGITSILFLVKK